MAISTWRTDLPEEKVLADIASTKKVNELWEVAKTWYGFDQETAKKYLKEAGHEKWNPANWFEYLNILRDKWIHVQEERIAQAHIRSRNENIKRLYEESTGAKWNYETVPYTLEGPAEAIEAYWKLQDLLRERNVKTCRARFNKVTEV